MNWHTHVAQINSRKLQAAPANGARSLPILTWTSAWHRGQLILLMLTLLLCVHLFRAEAWADSAQMAGTDSVTIVGGEQAEQGEWGWQVLVRANSSLCGGSLVAPDWVLTAAHCLFTNSGDAIAADAIRVTVGETYRNVVEGTEQTLGVDARFVHEAYEQWHNANDIALLHLAVPAELNNAVAIVPLLTDARRELASEGKLATVTGWGTTTEGGYPAENLMKVSVPIVSNAVCNDSYGIISDNMICGGYAEGGKDSCQGDSGGPLVVPDGDSNWYLAGVVSFGYGCARANYYGVYTRVSSYVDWVQSTMRTYREHTINEETDPQSNSNDSDSDAAENQTGSTTTRIFLPVVMH